MNCTRRTFVALGASALAGATAGCGKEKSSLLEWIGRPSAPDLDGALTPPAATEVDEISHLLNRLTFGPRPGDYAHATALGAAGYVEEQLAPERLDDWHCERIIRHEFDELSDPDSHLFPRRSNAQDPMQQLFPALKDRGSRVGDLYEFKSDALLHDLTRAAILRATLSRRQLFEVMAQFWTDHFNVDPSKGEGKWLEAANDRDVIRRHALGNFRDLVRASAISPAMLWYLDGRVNQVKNAGDKPNENYARELMELHTLGVHGGYTQHDVMEVARCLSGWTVRDQHQLIKGEVEFDPKRHDNGEKSVLGQEIPAGLGAGDLDRVLEIVVRHPSTAQHLATKLCRRFIADDPPSTAVATVAAAFTRSDGHIPEILRALFATPEFAAARGTKLKRPFHFVVSALRAANAATDGGHPIVNALLRMGHAPFRYPTPDGYPEVATHWTNTLLWRWNFAVSLSGNQLAGTKIDLAVLQEKLGGAPALYASCLGRAPTAGELRACSDSGNGLALILASPAFQRF